MWVPKDAGWRYFKFRLVNDEWKYLTVYRLSKLRSLIKKFKPVDVYYSASSFLKPLELEHQRSGLRGKFLIGRLCVDFDDVHYSEVGKVYKFITEMFNLDLEYGLKTRKGRYQLVFLVPRDRYYAVRKGGIKAFKSWRVGFDRFIEKVYNSLEEQGFKIDYTLRKKHHARVIRLPEAPRKIIGKTVIPRFLTIPQIKRWAGDSVLKKLFRAFSIGNDQNLVRKNIKLGKHPAQLSNQSYYRRYVSSHVEGTKDRHITIIKIKIHKKKEYQQKNTVKMVNTLVKYRLQHLYLLTDDEYLYAISLKTNPLRRMKKILRTWNKEAQNLKQTFLPISRGETKNKEIIKKAPRYVGILADKEHKGNTHTSMQHRIILEMLGVPIKSDPSISYGKTKDFNLITGFYEKPKQ